MISGAHQLLGEEHHYCPNVRTFLSIGNVYSSFQNRLKMTKSSAHSRWRIVANVLMFVMSLSALNFYDSSGLLSIKCKLDLRSIVSEFEVDTVWGFISIHSIDPQFVGFKLVVSRRSQEEAETEEQESVVVVVNVVDVVGRRGRAKSQEAKVEELR